MAKPLETVDLVGIVRRGWGWMLGGAVLGVGLGLIAALTARPWYVSRASVMLNPTHAGLGDTAAQNDVVNADIIANHIELIRSRRTIHQALQSAGLMQLPSLIKHIDGKRDVVDYVASQLELSSGGAGPGKTARTIRIALVHDDERDVTVVLRSILQRYELTIEAELQEMLNQASGLVADAMQRAEKDLRAAEQERLAARQAAPVIFRGTGGSSVYQERAERLQEELIAAEIEIATLEPRLRRINEAIAELGESSDPADHLDKLALIDRQSLDRLGVFAGLQNEELNLASVQAAMPAQTERARAEITRSLELNAERQRLESIYGPGHPKIREINKQIAMVEDFIERSSRDSPAVAAQSRPPLDPQSILRAYVGFLTNDLATLENRREELQTLTAEADRQARTLIAVELNDQVLQQRVVRQQALYEQMVSQMMALDTAGGLAGYTYDFIEVPREGQIVWPKKPMIAGAGLVVGLILGTLVSLWREFSDDRFKSVAEIEGSLGVKAIGTLGSLDDRLLLREDGVPDKAIADEEAVRMLRAMLLTQLDRRKCKSVGVTSAKPGEGKSTVVAHLAVSLARSGRRVLLIDADLRRPRIHQLFDRAPQDGLGDWLCGQLAIADCIKPTEIDELELMTAGQTTRSASEWLQTPRMQQLIAQLSSQYDVILVDLPPVLAVTDPLVVLPQLDAGLLVVRVSQAQRDTAVGAAERIVAAGGHLIGTVLNRFDCHHRMNDATYSYATDYKIIPIHRARASREAVSAVGVG